MLGTAAEELAGARGNRAHVRTLFRASSVPMVIVDDDRRYVDVNGPGLFAFRLSLAEMRARRIDDLTPTGLLGRLDLLWRQLRGRGHVSGHYEAVDLDGSPWRLAFYGLSEILPGLHIIAFAPEGCQETDFREFTEPIAAADTRLTPRELEVLHLASAGRSGPRIAEELALSPGTVKKHFENIYSKLEVRGRSAAVAKAIRLHLIQ
jgi:DNA-binding CsgD family transcriptional regulator